jgi:hypothetical protein
MNWPGPDWNYAEIVATGPLRQNLKRELEQEKGGQAIIEYLYGPPTADEAWLYGNIACWDAGLRLEEA